MKPLSAVDAIAPAFSRMRLLLAPPDPLTGQPGPFRFWFFVKMMVVGALTSVNLCAVGISMTTQLMMVSAIAAGARSRLHSGGSFFGSAGTAFLILAALILGFVVLAIVVVVGWLWSRLRLTLFDLVVYRHGRVSVGWSRYPAQSWRYLGMTILTGLILLILLAATSGPMILHLVVTLRNLSPQQINADPTLVFRTVLPLYAVAIPFGVLVALVDAVLQDFLLPPMAIEDAPIERSIGRFLRLLREHFGQVVLYFILRLVIVMGLAVAGGLAAFLVTAVAAGFGVGGGFLVYHGIAHAGSAGMVVFVLYCIVVGLAVLALSLVAMFTVNGIIGIFKQCFAAYFYGSHYPELGNRLEPLPARPPVPAAPQVPPMSAAPEPPPAW